MSKKFRLNAKSIFITLPRCSASKEECLKIWTTKLQTQEIEDYLIVQEHHKEGGELEGVEGDLHIHAALFLKKKCDFTTPSCLDILDYHGKYEGIKNKEKTIEYLLKEDKNPLQSRNWAEWLRASKKHQTREKNLDFLTQVIEKGPIKMVQEGELSLMNLQKTLVNLKAYNTLIEESKREEEIEDIPATLENPWGINIKVDTDLKCCHYWLYSRQPNLGKTTWGTELCTKYRAAFYNYSEIYQPQIGPSTEVIILDEYRAQLKVTQLNQMCDGSLYFTGKNMTSWKLKTKPVVIILANRSPSEAYKKQEDETHTDNIALIEARFNVICLDKYKK